MVTVEKKEEIRRSYFVEKKSIRKIAEKFGCSRRTVRKAIADSGVPVYKRTASIGYLVLGPVIPIIVKCNLKVYHLLQSKSLPPCPFISPA